MCETEKLLPSFKLDPEIISDVVGTFPADCRFALHSVGLFNPLPANTPFDDVLKMMVHKPDKTIEQVKTVLSSAGNVRCLFPFSPF